MFEYEIGNKYVFYSNEKMDSIIVGEYIGDYKGKQMFRDSKGKIHSNNGIFCKLDENITSHNIIEDLSRKIQNDYGINASVISNNSTFSIFIPDNKKAILLSKLIDSINYVLKSYFSLNLQELSYKMKQDDKALAFVIMFELCKHHSVQLNYNDNN